MVKRVSSDASIASSATGRIAGVISRPLGRPYISAIPCECIPLIIYPQYVNRWFLTVLLE